MVTTPTPTHFDFALKALKAGKHVLQEKAFAVTSRTDVQEKQLVAGMCPDNALYGLEEPGGEGILSTVSADGQLAHLYTDLKRTSYSDLFDAVYRSIRFDDAYHISEVQVIQQLIVLET